MTALAKKREASGTAAYVALRSIGKRYRRRGPWVLRHLDLDVSPGTVVELRGANGAASRLFFASSSAQLSHAVHLASALAFGADTTLVTWDQELGRAAVHVGCAVAPAVRT